uniref:Uncharacterized protein n=1 Tax=Trichinella nativa TaxID=6335 RepID=A0A0V1KGW8_9BILA
MQTLIGKHSTEDPNGREERQYQPTRPPRATRD